MAVSRLFRRLQGIRLVQSSDYYKQASELGPADMMPGPPDPYDDRISKRDWESQMAVWRNRLKTVAAEH